MNRNALAVACLAAFTALAAGAQGLKSPAQRAGAPAGGPAGLARSLSSTGVAKPAARAASDAAAPAAPQQADYIMAVVNSEPVTRNEVRARMARVEQAMAAQGGPRLPQAELEREVLERLILEKIQLQIARESGIRVDDYAIHQAEQAVARQNGVDVPEMQRRLNAEGVTPQRFRAELRNQLLMQRVREREVESRLKVSDLDIDQYLREQGQSPDAVRTDINLGHILVLVPEDASPAQEAKAKARAEEAAAKLRAGGDFAALAREYSDAPEGARGGELGLRPADRYPELFVTATAQTPVGGLVGPVRSPAGFHLLKVIEKTRASAAGMVVQQNHARHILLRPSAQLSENAAAARLQDWRRRVLAGQDDFAALAREHSQDRASGKEGGDLGWAGPGRYVPEFEEALSRLSPGDISDPIATRFGVHLIQLIDRRQAPLTQRELRDMARDAVREKKFDEAYVTWLQEARARAYVEYREKP